VRDRIEPYFDTLLGVIREAQCSDRQGAALPLHQAFERVRGAARAAHAAGNTITFVGNGGSAAIASHLAIDFSKNGGMRARALNDGAALTCLGNDLGYEHVFAKQIEWHARPGDLVVAISSSGRSANILNAVEAARARDCTITTFSGFREDNELRRAGDVNFYVRSGQYGFVEVAHLALCHAILDLDMGWTGDR
jgi:D-sedoheptulose 7-phosphate isomerase